MVWIWVGPGHHEHYEYPQSRQLRSTKTAVPMIKIRRANLEEDLTAFCVS